MNWFFEHVTPDRWMLFVSTILGVILTGLFSLGIYKAKLRNENRKMYSLFRKNYRPFRKRIWVDLVSYLYTNFKIIYLVYDQKEAIEWIINYYENTLENYIPDNLYDEFEEIINELYQLEVIGNNFKNDDCIEEKAKEMSFDVEKLIKNSVEKIQEKILKIDEYIKKHY